MIIRENGREYQFITPKAEAVPLDLSPISLAKFAHSNHYDTAYLKNLVDLILARAYHYDPIGDPIVDIRCQNQADQVLETTFPIMLQRIGSNLTSFTKAYKGG